MSATTAIHLMVIVSFRVADHPTTLNSQPARPAFGVLDDINGRNASFSAQETDAMSLIDWSDPAEMLGLLVEYVADEAGTSHDDPDRLHFLSELSLELGALAVHDFASADEIELPLREIIDSQPRDFANDSVMAHLEACIEELHRIEAVHRRREAAAP